MFLKLCAAYLVFSFLVTGLESASLLSEGVIDAKGYVVRKVVRAASGVGENRVDSHEEQRDTVGLESAPYVTWSIRPDVEPKMSEDGIVEMTHGNYNVSSNAGPAMRNDPFGRDSPIEQAADNFDMETPGSELVYDGPFMMYASHYLRPFSALREIPHEKGIYAAFIVKAGLVVMAAFAVMFLYSQWHEVIAERTGLKLAHVCMVTYAGLSVSIDLSIKNAAESNGGSFPFNPACGVVVVEYLKLIISLILFAAHVRVLKGRGEVVQVPNARDVGWLAIPAAIYAASNVVVFKAIMSAPMSSFGVIRETMLFWNALIWTLAFRQPLSKIRWLAILGIFIGCSMNQIPKMLDDEVTFGALWVCLLAFMNAAGGVANEYAFKQKAQIDINLQSAIVYAMCGSFVLIGMAIFNNSSLQSVGAFFTGFEPQCWTVIVLQAFTGLAVSRILKYVDAITKTMVVAIRGPSVIFLAAYLFNKRLHPSELIAILCVVTSSWVYLREGPLTQPKPP